MEWINGEERTGNEMNGWEWNGAGWIGLVSGWDGMGDEREGKDWTG